jgi:hypothetical protein
MKKIEVTEAKTDREILSCFDVMNELRTQLKREEFLQTVRAMEVDGYRLAFIEDEGDVVAVAGFRIYSNLFMG